MHKIFTSKRITETLTALALAALVLFSSWVMARNFSVTEIARHSRVVSLLARREHAAGLVDRRSLHMATGFAEALAKASIGLEQIPTDELGTFFAVFDSLPPNVFAEDFAYSGNALIIKGTAENLGGYTELLESLNEHRRFSGVRGEFEETGQGVEFVIVCGLK